MVIGTSFTFTWKYENEFDLLGCFWQQQLQEIVYRTMEVFMYVEVFM